MHLRVFYCAAAAALSTFLAVPTIAADKVGRYTVEIKVDGQQSWRAGNDWSKSTTTEHYRIVTSVKSTGELDSVNVKDPEFAQKQMQKAARVQQAVQKAQGRAPATAAPTQEAYVAQQKKLAEQMQKGQAACKGDTNCLVQMAMQYSQQSAAMLPPGSAPAGGAMPDAGDEEAEEEERYLSYFGYEGCPTEIDIRIDQRSEGAYADVAGMIPWTTTQTGNSKGTDIDRKMQCLAATTVYDVKARTIYTDGFGTPGVRGRYESNDKLQGKTVNTDAEIMGSSEALEWVSQQLRQAPASGSKSTVLKPKNAANLPTGAKLEGQIKVSLTWRFDP